jgi:hypothetical protein
LGGVLEHEAALAGACTGAKALSRDGDDARHPALACGALQEGGARQQVRAWATALLSFMWAGLTANLVVYNAEVMGGTYASTAAATSGLHSLGSLVHQAGVAGLVTTLREHMPCGYLSPATQVFLAESVEQRFLATGVTRVLHYTSCGS